MKHIDIEFLEKGIKIKPLHEEAKEVLHTEEFKKGAEKIIDDFLEAKKNKKD